MTDVIGSHDERPLARDRCKLHDPDLAGEEKEVAAEGDDDPMEGCSKHSLREGTTGMLLSWWLTG